MGNRKSEVSDLASEIGYEIIPNDATESIYLGFGIVVGILIGMIAVPLSVPASLGSGGGALVSGRSFGRARARPLTFWRFDISVGLDST